MKGASIDAGTNELQDGVALSPTDVWAVGWGDTLALSEHWDGSNWTVVSPVSPGNHSNYLEGVAAVSTTELWGVGYYLGPGSQTLIEHYCAT